MKQKLFENVFGNTFKLSELSVGENVITIAPYGTMLSFYEGDVTGKEDDEINQIKSLSTPANHKDFMNQIDFLKNNKITLNRFRTDVDERTMAELLLKLNDDELNQLKQGKRVITNNLSKEDLNAIESANEKRIRQRKEQDN